MRKHRRLLIAVSLLLTACGAAATDNLRLGTWLMEEAAAEGRPDSPKYDEAFRFLRPLALAGNAEAQFHLANLYSGGLGSLPMDSGRAARLMRSAAAQGLAKAQFMMGHYHEEGVGVWPDRDEALVWYRRAAKGGHPMAIARLMQLNKY